MIALNNNIFKQNILPLHVLCKIEIVTGCVRRPGT